MTHQDEAAAATDRLRRALLAFQAAQNSLLGAHRQLKVKAGCDEASVLIFGGEAGSGLAQDLVERGFADERARLYAEAVGRGRREDRGRAAEMHAFTVTGPTRRARRSAARDLPHTHQPAARISTRRTCQGRQPSPPRGARTSRAVSASASCWRVVAPALLAASR